MKREVVDEDAEKTRANKSTSFDLTSQSEVDLLNYAENKELHGNYSEFVKRLIGKHKRENEQLHVHSVQAPIPIPDITAVKTDGFL